MKKIIAILLISLSLISLVGCNKEPEGLNPDRSTNHKYDFINYLKLDTVGPNGAAIIEVKISDFNVTDFETESDYIAVRKIMEKIVDSIVFDKSENLTNGDIITVGIAENFDTSIVTVDMNLEPIKLQVENLPEPVELDLYADENVSFFALYDTKDVYADFPETSTFSAELKENLEYSISPQTDDKLEINSTILSITAKLSDELLLNPDTDYKTTDMYFKKHGYVVNLSGEKVLRNIVMPINFEQVDHQLILDTLKDRLSEEPITVGEINYYFERVGSVQQLKDQKEGKAFEYIVMAEYSDANGQPAYFRLNVKMVYFNSKIIILSYNNQEAGTVSSEYFAKPYNNANMLIVASEQAAVETPDQNQETDTAKE